MLNFRSALFFCILSSTLACATAQQVYLPEVVDLAFKQGARGDCPSVAITKWAISTYGTLPATGILAVTSNEDGSKSVSLADGAVVTVTAEQQIIAATHSAFDPQYSSTDRYLPSLVIRKDVLDAANLLYAVLAIRARETKNGGINDGRKLSRREYEKGFHFLDDGGEVDTLFEYLGFKIVDQTNFPTEVPNVFGSATHVVFVLNHTSDYDQNIYDDHGTPKAISSYDYPVGRNGHRWRYSLDPDIPTNTAPIVVRQCERTPGKWDACPEFAY